MVRQAQQRSARLARANEWSGAALVGRPHQGIPPASAIPGRLQRLLPLRALLPLLPPRRRQLLLGVTVPAKATQSSKERAVKHWAAGSAGTAARQEGHTYHA